MCFRRSVSIPKATTAPHEASRIRATVERLALLLKCVDGLYNISPIGCCCLAGPLSGRDRRCRPAGRDRGSFDYACGAVAALTAALGAVGVAPEAKCE